MSLRFAILGLLAEASGSGYDLLRRFDETLANVWPATQSQLYSELNKLAAQEMIEICGRGGRGRKVYRVTNAGGEALEQWIRSPDQDLDARCAMLLRIFLLGTVSASEARQLLLDGAQRAQNDVQRLEKLRYSLQSAGTSLRVDAQFFSRAVLDYGIAKSNLDSRWMQAVVVELDTLSSASTVAED